VINDGPLESAPEKFVAAKYSFGKVILICGFHGLGKKGLRRTMGRWGGCQRRRWSDLMGFGEDVGVWVKTQSTCSSKSSRLILFKSLINLLNHFNK
jgi:hypothetical protein